MSEQEKRIAVLEAQLGEVRSHLSKLAEFVKFPRPTETTSKEDFWHRPAVITALAGIFTALVASVTTVLWGYYSSRIEHERDQRRKDAEQQERRLAADYQRKLKLKTELDTLFAVQRGAYGTRCRLGLAEAYYELKEKWLIRPQLATLRHKSRSGDNQRNIERLDRELEATSRSSERDDATRKEAAQRVAEVVDLDLVLVNVESFFEEQDTRNAARSFASAWRDFMASIEPASESARQDKLVTAAADEYENHKHTGATISLQNNALRRSWLEDKKACDAKDAQLVELYRKLNELMGRDVQSVWPKNEEGGSS